MSDISDLEQRITAALDRIGAGLDRMGGAGDADPAALQEALDAEKMTNAQLEERVRALKDQHEAQLREVQAGPEEQIAALQAETAELKAALQEANAQARALKQSNQQMQASLQSLTEAGVASAEPQMINQAMMSELEGLRAARATDIAELDEILGALKPMLTEAQDA